MANLLEIKNVTKVYQRGLLSSNAKIALKEFSLVLKDDEPTIMTVAGACLVITTVVSVLAFRSFRRLHRAYAIKPLMHQAHHLTKILKAWLR